MDRSQRSVGDVLPVGLGRQLTAAIDPNLAGRLGSFRRMSAQLPLTAHGRAVAVIGRSPGSGTSTVVAAMALAAAGYTDSRVMVLDTNNDSAAGPPAAGGAPVTGRSVAALLSPVDGRPGSAPDGRLPVLLAVPDGEPVARSRVRAAATPGTAVPVLAPPAGAGDFPPQMLTAALDRLRMRSDLTLVDTPTDPGRPVFRATLHLVDAVLLVIPADRLAPERLAAARDWLAAIPGPQRTHDISVVLVARDTSIPQWRPEDLPWTLLRRDAALARGQLGRMSRRSGLAALELVARVSRPLGPTGRRDVPG